MNVTHLWSFHRRIERRWAQPMRSLGQIHGKIVVAAERALQWVFGNNGSLIPIPVRAAVDRRRLEGSRPRD